MRIAEIYRSVQGEGRLTGTPSVFVRTSGCNLRCWFCDTPYTSWRPEGDDLSVEEVLERTLAHADAYVVLTGGEPMLWAELVPLAAELRLAGRHVTIETAGTLHLPLECDLLSLSPKFASSGPPAETPGGWAARHERSRERTDVLRRLMSEHDYQLKFVIDAPGDCAAAEALLAELGAPPERVWLMPQGIEAAELAARGAWLEPYCRARGYRFCPRKQIEWFGAGRGK